MPGRASYRYPPPLTNINDPIFDEPREHLGFLLPPTQFGVKLPDNPEKLGLDDPYPQLKSRWDASHREWRWAIPTLEDIPDVSRAIELSRRFQPDKGPMPTP